MLTHTQTLRTPTEEAFQLSVLALLSIDLDFFLLSHFSALVLVCVVSNGIVGTPDSRTAHVRLSRLDVRNNKSQNDHALELDPDANHPHAKKHSTYVLKQQERRGYRNENREVRGTAGIKVDKGILTKPGTERGACPRQYRRVEEKACIRVERSVQSQPSTRMGDDRHDTEG